MHMRRMFPESCRRKAENPAGIGALVRQSAVDEPVENPVQGHPIQCHAAQLRFDFGMRQGCGGIAQHVQDADPRRCRTRADATDLLSDRLLR